MSMQPCTASKRNLENLTGLVMPFISWGPRVS